MQFKTYYCINKENVNSDTFDKFFTYLKVEGLSYNYIQMVDTSEEELTYEIGVEDYILMRYLEKISEYNERLEQRLSNL